MTPDLRRELRREGLVAVRNREGADHLAGYGFAPDVVADVGVHHGTPALYAAFPQAQFVLIDPRAEVADDLRARPARYDFVACAAGPVTARRALGIPVTKRGPAAAMAGFRAITGPMARSVTEVETREVDMRPLDDILAGYPGRVGLKIDTEGFELDVLQGADATLARADFVILELSLTRRFGAAQPCRRGARPPRAGAARYPVAARRRPRRPHTALYRCPVYKVARMIRIFLALTLTATLAACNAQTQDQLARGAARSATSKVLAERLPGVPLQPAVNCVIDNASAQQIYALAADSVAGPTQSTVEIVTGILRQPETVRCLAADGLPALLAGNGLPATLR